MLTDIFNLLKNTLLNRKFLTSLLAPIIGALLLQIPDFPFTAQQVTEVIITIILFVVGGDVLNDLVNSSKGNVWNSQTRRWQKDNNGYRELG